MRGPLRHTAVLVSLVLLAAACGTGGQAKPGNVNAHTLIVGSGTVPRILYGGVQSGFATALPSTQLFASPVRFTDSLDHPQPYLAKSWEFSKDGLHVTLHLVDGATFHDGQPITSEDVAFSIDVVKKYHPFGRVMFGAVESVSTPDPHTAVLNLSQPAPAIVTAMSPGLLPILPKHVYGSSSNLRTDPRLSHQVVGSGPFKLVSFTSGDKIVLERNPNFFLKGEPKLQKIVIQHFPDENTLALSLEKGEIQMAVGLTGPPQLARLTRDKALSISQRGYEALGSLAWLMFNTKDPVLKDVRVRQAISYAIDPKFFISKLQQGYSKRAPSPIAPGTPFFDPNVHVYNHDPQKARALLDQAGYPQKGATRFSLTMDYDPGGEEAYEKNVAEAIKSELAQVGIAVTVRSTPDEPSWGQVVSNYNFQMSMDNVWNWGDPTIGVARTYLCSNIRKGVLWANMEQYCNPEVDQLLTAAAKEVNHAKRKELYDKFQEAVTSDVPIDFLSTAQFHNAYIKGLVDPPNGVWGSMAPMLTTDVR